jgi:hypothetical protein
MRPIGTIRSGVIAAIGATIATTVAPVAVSIAGREFKPRGYRFTNRIDRAVAAHYALA